MPLKRPFLADKAVPAPGEIVGSTVITMTKETYDDDPPAPRPRPDPPRSAHGKSLGPAHEAKANGRRPFVERFSVSGIGHARGQTLLTKSRETTYNSIG
jgi:hypothetical protein